MKSPYWIVPEIAGGIRNYSDSLLAELGKIESSSGELPDADRIGELATTHSLFHIQHEYGLFGSKIPGWYRFPRWFASAKAASSGIPWIATAHTVLPPAYCLPWKGRGLQALPRFALNVFFANYMRRLWTRETWSPFDRVVVHSEIQAGWLREAGVTQVRVIPHFVPRITSFGSTASAEAVVLFGYFTPEKGQDIAIRAWAALGDRAPRLVLAGGVRRTEDQHYYDGCLSLIRKLRLEKKVEVTGYVRSEDLDSLYRRALFVLAPFRETAGSGSIVHAFARGAAILASDLPLNRELAERVPECMAFFRSEDIDDLAGAVERLASDEQKLDSTRTRALCYAEMYSIQRIAKMHWDMYREFTV